MKSLCEHVDLRIDRDGKHPVAVIERGAASARFTWSRKLQADVPRLICSVCGKSILIYGYAVARGVAGDNNYVPF